MFALVLHILIVVIISFIELSALLMLYWGEPLYTRKYANDVVNYAATNLTSQINKVVENVSEAVFAEHLIFTRVCLPELVCVYAPETAHGRHN